MIELGKKGKDKISGLEGIITGRATYMYGCDQYCIVPLAKDNAPSEGFWYDEGRIEVIDEGIKPEEVQVERKGGPQFCPLKTG
jgi:hypothetical protein